MLTFFTTGKPFQEPFATLQRNALKSWTRMSAVSEVVLFGDEAGAGETAAELGVRHVSTVERNDLGMPLVRSLFEQVAAIATTPYVCYANADIIFMEDLAAALERAIAATRWFLLIGQRYNVDMAGPLEFGAGWQQALRQHVVEHGTLFYSGVDYFVYPRTMWTEVPDTLVVGRAGWEYWPVYEARLRKAIVIDATQSVMAVHPNHDYSHHPEGVNGVYAGLESSRNYNTIGGTHNALNALDATHLMTDEGLRLCCRSCYPMCVCKPASF